MGLQLPECIMIVIVASCLASVIKAWIRRNRKVAFTLTKISKAETLIIVSDDGYYAEITKERARELLNR